MVYSAGQPPPPPTVISAEVMIGDPSHPSIAVALPVLAGAVSSPHWMVILAGQVMTGAVLSSTTMTCTHAVLLPQPSVAVHVRLMVCSCGQPPAVVTSLKVTTGIAAQLSVAVAVPVFAGSVLAVHSIVTFTGHVMAGAWVSSVDMICTHVEVFPQWSVANQVLVIKASEAHPLAAVTSLNVTVGAPSQLSVAVAIPVFTGNVLSVHCMVMFAGHVIAGAVLSSIKIICAQVLTLPQSSVALHVRVIVLSCGQSPATVASVKSTTGTASQLSVAVAEPVLAGRVLAVHCIVILAGQVMAGAVLSSITMDCAHVLELPQASVALQVRVITNSCGHPPPAVTSVKFTVGAASQLSVAVAEPVLAGKVLVLH